MSDPLAQAKKELQILIENIEKHKSFYSGVRLSNPHFNSVSEENWKLEEAKCWKHGTDYPTQIEHLPRPLIVSTDEGEKISALDAHKKWLEERDASDSGYSEYFCSDKQFKQYQIPAPEKDENLVIYIYRLRDVLESKPSHPSLWIDCLHSFLNFLRNNYSRTQIAFIEYAIPEEMDIIQSSTFQKNSKNEVVEIPISQIIRKVSARVYPIYVIDSASILKELANQVLTGRPNFQLSCAEALALCWMCLTTSRLRSLAQVGDLLSLSKDSLKLESTTLSVPIYFGIFDLKISENMASYLNALSLIPSVKPRTTILQLSKGTLYRTLQKIIQKLKFPACLGKITFQTFLSEPGIHPHRYQPKKSKKGF